MLISESYKAEQQAMHQRYPNYGTASIGYAEKVSALIDQLGVTDVLDYGCGKGNLAKHLDVSNPIRVTCYDPGIPGIDDTPDPAEMVCCIDVLEHIEPHLIHNVLDDLKRATKQYGFFTVHTGPAVKTLSDGRNAHLIQEPMQWWLPLFWERFEIHHYVAQPQGFYVFVRARHD
jgi:hypothetical protein